MDSPTLTAYQLLAAHLTPYRQALLIGMGVMLFEMLAARVTLWMAGHFKVDVQGECAGDCTGNPAAYPRYLRDQPLRL
jgi:hypothetical protein